MRIYTDTPPFKFRFSAADYLAFTEQQTRFEQHATYTDRAVSFSNGDTAELLRTRVVSWGFFSVLGITPVIGRDFTEQDGRAGSSAGRDRRATRSGSSGSAAAPTRSASRFGSTAPTTRSIGVLPPALGPLERRYDLFLIQQFTPPTRKGPFFYSVIARLPHGADRALAAERAARDQPRAVSDLEVVVPGRQVDVEHGGPQDQPRRRRRHARRARARRRRRWCG